MARVSSCFHSLLPLALAGFALQARGEILFSDNFDTDTSANWNVFSGGYTVTDPNATPPAIELGNQNDYTIQWAFDYSQQSYNFFTDATTSVALKVPPAPHSNGTSKGVKITINKDELPSRNGVNLYPKGKSFSGDYVLSFDVFMNYSDFAGGGSGTTEYALYGLNFTGTELNWMSADFSSSFHAPAPGSTSSDGIWFMNTGDGGAGRNWRMCFGKGPTLGPIDPALADPPASEIAFYGDRDGDGRPDNRLTVDGDYSPWMKNIFPSPPGELAGITGKTWNTVEVSQYKGTVTWKMNGKIISRFVNPTPYTAGDIMIGYMDIFESIANPLEETWVIFDNVRVETIRTVVVNTADNASPAGDGKTSLNEALTDLQDHDLITFNIPGDGVQVIKTPIGGYPLIAKSSVVIDGYSQPGAAANTNGILGGNSAKLKIVLDSTSSQLASTRLPYSGYGGTENAMLGLLGAKNVTIRGLSFQARFAAGSEEDPNIYCIALIQGASNCKVQGNWFGLAPDGVTVKGANAGVTGFRYEEAVGEDKVYTYSDGLVLGTDSDGFDDPAEFNIISGNSVALSVQLPGLRVAGNYFNVLPNGKTFLDVNQIYEQLVAIGADGKTVENIENGRLTTGTIIGVSGDGINDANERNVFNYAYYETLTELYGNADGLRVSGNYYGVGVDGTTTAPPVSTDSDQPNLISLPSPGEILIGSNFDGVSDSLEGNLIYGVPGSELVAAGVAAHIIARANTLKGNGFTGFTFADGSNNRNYVDYYAGIVADPAKAVPIVTSFSNNILKGSLGLPTADYPYVDVDIYLADPNAPENEAQPGTKLTIPGTYLGTYSDGVPEEDANPAPGEFEFDLTALNVPGGANICVVASYQKDETSSNPGRAVSSPVSNAVSTGGSAPIGAITVTVEGANLRLTWTGGTPPFQVQGRPSLNTGSWNSVGAPTSERTALVPITNVSPSFFQVQGQ